MVVLDDASLHVTVSLPTLQRKGPAIHLNFFNKSFYDWFCYVVTIGLGSAVNVNE